MLKRVKKCIESIQKSSETFNEYFIQYVKDVQDTNIDREVRNQIRFGILQLSHIDHQIEFDYRKLVNEQNAKFS